MAFATLKARTSGTGLDRAAQRVTFPVHLSQRTTDAADVRDDTLDLFGAAAAASTQPESAETLRHMLALASIPGVGVASVSALMDHFSDLGRVWEASSEELRLTLKNARTPHPDRVVDAVAASRDDLLARGDRLAADLTARGVTFLNDQDERYPHRLRELAAPPRWLFVEGNVGLLGRASTAGVVGTRQPTPFGVAATRRLAESLVELGFVVVSGLAEGIDEAAHRTTVELGGLTVAALGTGILLDFPASNTSLRRQIVDGGGAVVSEYLPDTRYSKQTFVARNRIIAALSSVVFPVEAAAKSGTAHTIRFAQELRRPLVGAILGDVERRPANEIVTVLAKEGAPVFNAAAADFAERLAAFLAPYGGDAERKPLNRADLYRRVYGGALRALWSAFRLRPPEPEAVKWLEDFVLELAKRSRERGPHD